MPQLAFRLSEQVQVPVRTTI